ncbi:MAG: hypothetical protein A2166_05765 [Omnitrophica WOR_2 bacterium RBG_13_41_10]|nr:MAG: hypothetical protein A2166_05765 [Omnitrophica WOR_2 bacterium RBG_13_41_10]
MKLSTKGRYGVRLMLELALCYGKGPVFLKDIAGRQEISEKYLWHLITPLKTAGLINSSRGAHGGYALAKPPSEINLKEIIDVLEGSLSLVECVENTSVCRRVQFCVTRDIWQEITDKITQTLRAVTLKDMVDKQKAKHKSAFAYNI